MPVMVRGRALGVADNGVFTASNTDPIPGGRLWPEAAATWNAMRAAYIADGGNPGDFMPAGPVSSARPLDAQRYFYANQPPAAAYPGTSNHGWAIAVDIPYRDAQAWLRRNAHRYGWSWDEGKRVGEPWHWTYVGLPTRQLARLRRQVDPRRGFTPSEKRWIAEFDRRPSAARRRVLVRVMRQQRKRIWKLAQPVEKGGDGKGWTRARKRRYAALHARTT
jgi:hypothetical protein